MTLLKRYIFKQTFLLTLLIAASLAGAVWLTQSLRLLDYVMVHGLSLFMFFKLTSFLLPSLISTILPLSFLGALLFVFTKFYTERELIVMRTVGLSNFQIVSPLLMVALCILSFLYTINFYVQPFANKNFKDLRQQIRHNLTGRWIQPGTFTNFQGITFYAKAKTRGGDIKGVFVYDARDAKETITITAQLGKILETPEGLQFLLFHGTRQALNHKTNKPTLLNFEQYSLTVKNPSPQIPRSLKANELSIDELLHPDPSMSHKQITQIKVEMHERFLLPLIVFPFGVIASTGFLCGDYNRRARIKRILKVCFICLSLQLSLIALLNLSDKYPFFIEGSYAFVIVTLLMAFKILLSETPQKTFSSLALRKERNT